jgi:hypothetical protein
VITTPGPTAEPPATPYRLVYREFGPTEDIIWSVPPADLSQKQEIVRIPHREGFGIKPSLSPDGKMLAYLTLPEYALSAQSSQAEAYVMDLEKKEPVLIGGGMDLGYAPMWSPDSRLLYFRQYAGAEFLNADVIILRAKVQHPDDPTPTPTPLTPTPTLPPEATPRPTPEPLIEEVLRDTVAHVLSFTPVGFADDGKSMYFVQVNGGTGGGTLAGIYTVATTQAIAEARAAAQQAQLAADQANQAAAAAAAAAGQPPPEPATPVPLPNPARFVVEMSQQVAFDFELNGEGRKISYLVQEFAETGEILNRAYVADMIEATAAPFPVPGLPVGHHLRPVWHPDNQRLTLGVLRSDGLGQVAVIKLDGSEILLLPNAEGGFDQPRSWAPDGSWLAVAHSAGSSLANPGRGRLDLIAVTGQRYTVIEGADNASEDSVLGWLGPEPEPTP